MQPLRPAVPAASIADAGFLSDGQMLLTVMLPPSHEPQLWLVDGGERIRRSGPPEARGIVVITPDGAPVVYLNHGQHSGTRLGLTGVRFDEVWFSKNDGERGEQRYALPLHARYLVLLDLSWAPGSGASSIDPVHPARRDPC
jgi:hypothetical protein